MAAFCSKCGSSLPSDTGFCPVCGTPVGAGAVTSQPGFAPVAVPQAAPVQAVPPVYSQPPAAGYPPPSASGVPPGVAGYPAAGAYPPAKSSSGGALKIILIVIAVIVGLGLIAGGIVSYGVYRVSKAVHVDKNGDGVSVNVPGGPSVSVGDSTASAADLGIPVYPGAKREKGGMNMNAGGTSLVMAHFTTSDSPSQVVDFYKSKMDSETVSVVTGDNDGTVLNSGNKDTEHIMVTVGKGSGSDDGKTTIVVMHTIKK